MHSLQQQDEQDRGWKVMGTAPQVAQLAVVLEKTRYV